MASRKLITVFSSFPGDLCSSSPSPGSITNSPVNLSSFLEASTTHRAEGWINSLHQQRKDFSQERLQNSWHSRDFCYFHTSLALSFTTICLYIHSLFKILIPSFQKGTTYTVIANRNAYKQKVSRNLYVCVYMCVCLHVYVYVYIQTECENYHMLDG